MTTRDIFELRHYFTNLKLNTKNFKLTLKKKLYNGKDRFYFEFFNFLQNACKFPKFPSKFLQHNILKNSFNLPKIPEKRKNPSKWKRCLLPPPKKKTSLKYCEAQVKN